MLVPYIMFEDIFTSMFENMFPENLKTYLLFLKTCLHYSLTSPPIIEDMIMMCLYHVWKGVNTVIKTIFTTFLGKMFIHKG